MRHYQKKDNNYIRVQQNRLCPVCQADEADKLFTVPSEKYFVNKCNITDAEIVKCRKCKTSYTNPILSKIIENSQYTDPLSGYSNVTFHQPEDTCKLYHYIIFSELKHHVQTKHSRILDFACGWGSLVYLCQKEGISATGIDMNPNVIDIGRSLGITNLYTRELSFIESHSFDIIVANHVLEHLDSCVSVIQEFSRILRDGGCVLVAVPNYHSVRFLINKKKYWNAPYQHMNGLTAKGLDILFKYSGFENVLLKCPFFTALSGKSLRARLSLAITKFMGNNLNLFPTTLLKVYKKH